MTSSKTALLRSAAEQIDGVLMVRLPLLHENSVPGAGGGWDDNECGEDQHVYPSCSVLRLW